ncbi:unnamed protein product, partial [Polarella glacialis]
VRRKRLEARDPKQVEEVMYMPYRLLIEPHPRHLGATLDKLTLSCDRGRLVITEDAEMQAYRAASSQAARSIRDLPRDHVEWAASCKLADQEEEVFKDLRAIHEARRPLVPE